MKLVSHSVGFSDGRHLVVFEHPGWESSAVPQSGDRWVVAPGYVAVVGRVSWQLPEQVVLFLDPEDRYDETGTLVQSYCDLLGESAFRPEEPWEVVVSAMNCKGWHIDWTFYDEGSDRCPPELRDQLAQWHNQPD